MTKFPIMLYNTKSTKKALVPPIPPPSSYEDAVGWSAIEAGYKTALRGSRKFTREAVLYDLYSEVNNVRLWRDLKKIEKTRQAGVSEYTPGKYRHRIIVEPKERSLHIPPLRDKIVQLVIHQELQTLFRPVFVNRSFACMYGKGPIRAAFNVQHDMRVARMKWGDEATVIKIDVRKFFYSIDRSVLKQIIAKRFKKLKKKYPEKYEDFLRFYRLLCKVIDSSPEGERGIPLGNVSSQDFANIYLNELDQFCIRFLGATLYTRYMDDVVVIAPNKEIAREWLAKIKVFLQERLHLETNQKTKIFYVRQGVNAYGFKIKATHQADDGEAAGGHDHEGSDRPIGQFVARLRPMGLRLQSGEEDIRSLPLHQNGRRATLWRNISEPSSSADFTTTARRWQDPQSRGVTTVNHIQARVGAISPQCPEAFQTTASAIRPQTTQRSSSG